MVKARGLQGPRRDALPGSLSSTLGRSFLWICHLARTPYLQRRCRVVQRLESAPPASGLGLGLRLGEGREGEAEAPEAR